MKNNQSTAPDRKRQPPLALAPLLANEGEATRLASLIRPLPGTVLPSPGFLAQLRDRLLELPGQQQTAASRAA